MRNCFATKAVTSVSPYRAYCSFGSMLMTHLLARCLKMAASSDVFSITVELGHRVLIFQRQAENLRSR